MGRHKGQRVCARDHSFRLRYGRKRERPGPFLFNNSGLGGTDEEQATLYKMGQRLIGENAAVNRATYTLPNKHYIPVDMKYIGIDNTSPFQSPSFLGKRQGANVTHDTGLLRKSSRRFRPQGEKRRGTTQTVTSFILPICLAD